MKFNWVGDSINIGIPEWTLDSSISKLLENGYKVAIAEQTETLQTKNRAEKLINRKLVRIFTAGTFPNFAKGNDRDTGRTQILSIRTDGSKMNIILVLYEC